MLAVTGAQQPDVYGVWQSGYSAVCQWPAWNPTVRWRHKWDLHYNNNPMKYSVCARRHHMTARSSALLFTATICLLSDSSYHGRTQTCLAHGSDFVETETDSSCCTVNKCCRLIEPRPHPIAGCCHLAKWSPNYWPSILKTSSRWLSPFPRNVAMVTGKPTQLNGVENDASAPPPNLTSASCNLDLWPPDPEVYYRFMPLHRGSIVPICSEIGSFVCAITRSRNWWRTYGRTDGQVENSMAPAGGIANKTWQQSNVVYCNISLQHQRCQGRSSLWIGIWTAAAAAIYWWCDDIEILKSIHLCRYKPASKKVLKDKNCICSLHYSIDGIEQHQTEIQLF